MKVSGVPKIRNGIGEIWAQAVLETLQQLNLTDEAQFMGFDTAVSNTGNKNSCCIVLEQKNAEVSDRSSVSPLRSQINSWKSFGYCH